MTRRTFAPPIGRVSGTSSCPDAGFTPIEVLGHAELEGEALEHPLTRSGSQTGTEGWVVGDPLERCYAPVS